MKYPGKSEHFPEGIECPTWFCNMSSGPWLKGNFKIISTNNQKVLKFWVKFLDMQHLECAIQSAFKLNSERRRKNHKKINNLTLTKST